jgi:hypothetical protein
MTNPNLYRSVYRSLEREVLALTDVIHFDDDQTGFTGSNSGVHSVRIADLIVRCAVQIEAIAKGLYEQADGNMNPTGEDSRGRDLFFDTDCIAFIENKWKLGKKEVIITAFNISQKYRVLTPLKNSEKHQKPKWKKAYQSIKHNWSSSVNEITYKNKKLPPQGTIKNLINIMAALYLLNVYYANCANIATTAQGNAHIPIYTHPLTQIGSLADYNHGMYDTSPLNLSFGSEIFSVTCIEPNIANGIDMQKILHYVADVDIERHVVVPIFHKDDFSDEQKQQIVRIAIDGINHEIRRNGL